ncbi:MAG: putative transporter substrate-binding protein [Ramlibacter sp.]|jgi:iron(III) transport system substrate-binding protein|nr:putative transporter substrate-binding protein [Ramlibacter sp.]
MTSWLNMLLSVAALATAGTAAAQGSLATYEGADRMDKIVAAAKKEGTLTLYTTIAEKDLPTLIKPFESKYGIKVNVWRAGTDKVLQRTLVEAKANRHEVDVVHFGSPEMEALAREKVLQPVNSPAYRDLVAGAVPKHRMWAATLLSVWVQAYNTNLIKKADLPRTYQDLLDPKWKGKLGIEAKDEDWFASVMDVMGGKEKGLKFFQDLVARNGIAPHKGHTLLTNMVVSGEVPLALTVYNYMPEQAKRKGAPIDWFALEPAFARSNAVGVARQSPHPAAGLLFHEYMLTDAQQLMTTIDYVPSNTKVTSPLKGVKIVITDPAGSLDDADKWGAMFDETVLKRAGRSSGPR